MLNRKFIISCSHKEGHSILKSFWTGDRGFGAKKFAKIFETKKLAEEEGLCEVNSFFYLKNQANELQFYPKYGPAVVEELQ